MKPRSVLFLVNVLGYGGAELRVAQLAIGDARCAAGMSPSSR